MQPRETDPKSPVAGLPVVYCLPGSAAHCSGIRRGDVIVEVNGTAIADACAYLRACRLREDEMQVVVLRGGELIDLCVPLKLDHEARVNVACRFEC